MIRNDELGRVENLVLARLLVGDGVPTTRSKLAKDLEPLVQHRYAGAGWTVVLAQALETLELQGDVEVAKGGKSVYPTESGKARALTFLGVERLPAKVGWPVIKNVYLFARAMGVQANSASAVKKLSSVTGVRAVILREAHDLPTDEVPTQTQALDALLWKQLGRDSAEPFSMSAVKAYLLAQVLGTASNMTVAQLTSAVAAKVVSARRSDRASLCQGALRRLLGESAAAAAPATAPSRESLSLEQFAHDVLTAGRSSATGWFGDPAIANKVFVSHVHRAYADRHPDTAPDLAEFKTRLVEANRAGLLRLSRADLVEAMDGSDVRTSEIRHMNATYHFVVVKE